MKEAAKLREEAVTLQDQLATADSADRVDTRSRPTPENNRSPATRQEEPSRAFSVLLMFYQIDKKLGKLPSEITETQFLMPYRFLADAIRQRWGLELLNEAENDFAWQLHVFVAVLTTFTSLATTNWLLELDALPFAAMERQLRLEDALLNMYE